MSSTLYLLRCVRSRRQPVYAFGRAVERNLAVVNAAAAPHKMGSTAVNLDIEFTTSVAEPAQFHCSHAWWQQRIQADALVVETHTAVPKNQRLEKHPTSWDA
jgi:hypothetical protein